MGVQTDGQYQYFTEYNKQYMSPCPDCRNFNSIVGTYYKYILTYYAIGVHLHPQSIF